MRYLIWAAGSYYLVQGVVMWIWPDSWYTLTPGVAASGPFNLHFVRDIALIHVVAGLAILHGARQGARDVAITGLAWPVLHALYHIALWMDQGSPLDPVALVTLLAIQVPVWTSLALISSMPNQETRP